MPKIWFKDYTLEEINTIFDKFMTSFLDIRAVELSADSLVASMPVTDRVKQPFGILHGGASVVLAESVGSVASNLLIDSAQFAGVGMEVNANHLKSVSDGILYAYCSPLHIGKKSHVWDIKIKNEEDALICVSRLTVAIIEKK
ncbi:hotdog fold thioesterase [Sphingobacterium oryzagri]|uniref:Hotdog fold thioesterase n=1 Tax=Sphingobacterium oryzagri TaxID=3025669 RepID=A0ABY7WGA4_9SPHI|nr:hotdog fold thioesterase [Sphingobacterium sp. KACC 22765]WDF68510.1 hotdog fold thioesterase [Sphingobacterium sp. KACC 22765]